MNTLPERLLASQRHAYLGFNLLCAFIVLPLLDSLLQLAARTASHGIVTAVGIFATGVWLAFTAYLRTNSVLRVFGATALAGHLLYLLTHLP